MGSVIIFLCGAVVGYLFGDRIRAWISKKAR